MGPASWQPSPHDTGYHATPRGPPDGRFSRWGLTSHGRQPYLPGHFAAGHEERPNRRGAALCRGAVRQTRALGRARPSPRQRAHCHAYAMRERTAEHNPPQPGPIVLPVGTDLRGRHHPARANTLGQGFDPTPETGVAGSNPAGGTVRRAGPGGLPRPALRRFRGRATRVPLWTRPSSSLTALSEVAPRRTRRVTPSSCAVVRRTRRHHPGVSSVPLVQRRMAHAASRSRRGHTGGSARSAYARVRPRNALTAQGT